MALDGDGLPVLVVGAIGGALPGDAGHDRLEVHGAVMHHIRVRVEPLNDLLLVPRGAQVTLVRGAATVRVTDRDHLVVSVTPSSQLVLISRVSLGAGSTNDLIPTPLEMRVVIHAAGRGYNPVVGRYPGARRHYIWGLSETDGGSKYLGSRS